MTLLDKYQEKKELVQLDKYLEFTLGDEQYAMKLLDVREVITIPELTQMPNTPTYNLGIMNLRGQIITVLDLRQKLNIQSRGDKSEEAVLIVSFEDISIGLVVDSINKVLSFSTECISEVPEIGTKVNAKYIQGVYQAAESLTLLLDVESILDIEKIKNEKQIA